MHSYLLLDTISYELQPNDLVAYECADCSKLFEALTKC